MADPVLLRLGAISSLEALRPAEMYRLLADLPNRDPKGANAPSIYRSLLEHAAPNTDTPERQAFLSNGKLWGHLNDQADYYSVAQLRYSSRGSLPVPVRKLITLVDIDARRKTSEVERIFGVQQLKPSDVVLSVDKAAIETCSWSCFVSERLAQALPYLFACRLARTADVDGREMRRLGSASICVCAHFRASVTVEGIAREDVVFNAELDGIVVDQKTVFLISLRPEMPRLSQSFWRAVGDLLAELVDAAVGADFASILACEAPDDMRDLLQQISDGRADELLVQATARLAMDPSNAPTNEVLPLPLPPVPAPAPTSPVAPVEPNEENKESSKTPDEGTFQQTKAPASRSSEKIRFSTGHPASRGGKRVVQVTDEKETIMIATRYEEQEGRFIIAVNHIHGYAGPRCDLLSVPSVAIRDLAFETHSILLENVERFIEVKGRNQRTGAVELSENELLGAEKFGLRYFIYRVFCDPSDSSRELAILPDPIKSPTRQISRVARFKFDDASGAAWFSLVPHPIE